MYEFFHYLPVNDDVMKWGFYLIAAGRGVIPANSNYPPEEHPDLYDFPFSRGRRLPEYQIIVITNGYGVFESKETGMVQIKPDTLLLLFPDTWHRYKPDPKTGWTERWISLNGIIAHYLQTINLLNPKSPFFYLHDPVHLIHSFDLLLDSIHTNPTENNILTSLQTTGFIYEVIKLTGNTAVPADLDAQRPPDDVVLINTIIDLIWTHSHRRFSVETILQQVPCSRRTLERRFREVCGHSIHEEIIRCRLSRAIRLLEETYLPIKTIAYLSGFSHPERMRCAFKNTHGCPPSSFRRPLPKSLNNHTNGVKPIL